MPQDLNTRQTLDDPYPVATSHIFSVLSLDAEIKKSPEGMKQIDETL